MKISDIIFRKHEQRGTHVPSHADRKNETLLQIKNSSKHDIPRPVPSGIHS